MKKYLLFIALIYLYACSSSKVTKEETLEIIKLGNGANGAQLQISFSKGESFNHPSFVFWIEDMDGNFIETVFITESVATGIYKYGKNIKGKWLPDEKRYPASLPYWSHKRGKRISDGLYVPDKEHPITDAITGATPQSNFLLNARMKNENLRKFKILFEINQTWDFNEYWTNNKFPDNLAYKTSCQPALVYETIINLEDLNEKYEMKAIGHAHYAGETGELFTDLSTITTALNIVKEIIIQVKN